MKDVFGADCSLVDTLNAISKERGAALGAAVGTEVDADVDAGTRLGTGARVGAGAGAGAGAGEEGTNDEELSCNPNTSSNATDPGAAGAVAAGGFLDSLEADL